VFREILVLRVIVLSRWPSRPVSRVPAMTRRRGDAMAETWYEELLDDVDRLIDLM
jgi:hypothetical protein